MDTTGTLTLTDFLLARYAEDEAAAKSAADAQGALWFDEDGVVSSDTEPRRAPGRNLDMYAPEGRWMLWDCEGATSLGVHEATSAHIARHDPARVLADVEAKRRIVELHQPWSPTLGLNEGCATCLSDRDGYSDDWGPDAWPCSTLRTLALPYADHPDYDEAWRP